MKKNVILVIEDEPQIRKLLEISLESNDYAVRMAATAKEGLIMSVNHPPDLILLDIGLPDQSGQDVLVQLRAWYNKPIIMLSVLGDEENIVKALEKGANDYLVKPFRVGELIARIKTALRNSERIMDVPVIKRDHLQIDLVSRIVKVNNEVVKLTSTEYDLLVLLAKNEGKVLTHQFLLRQIWGPGYIEQTQYLRVFIAQLRKKIEADPNHPQIILTESGIGYRFVTIN